MAPVLLNPSIFGGGAPASYDSLIAAASPLGYWKFDEAAGTTAADSSGSAHPLTINGAIGLNATKVRPGGVSAFDFPGVVSARVDSVIGAAWMISASFTILAWINLDSITSYRCIWSRDVNGAGTRGPSFYVTSGKLNLFSSADNLGTATLSTGTNYFVVATFDSATSTLVYYINGVVDRTLTSISMPNSSAAYPIVVGASFAASPGLNFPFDGRIDDVAYIPSAISGADVAALYAAA